MGLAGPAGAAGAAGAAGQNGAAGRDGVTKVFTTNAGIPSIVGGQSLTVTSLTLPAGSWTVLGHIGGAHDDVDSSARMECTINEPGGSGTDFAKLRLPPNDNGATALVFFDINLHAVVTLAEPQTVKVTCTDVGVGDTGFTFTTHQMTAFLATEVTRQTG